MARWATLIALLGGCDVAFQLTAPPKQDAGIDAACIQPDEDGDCVSDSEDNCPGTANADQANSAEVAAGSEADGVGDACDPNPALGGDQLAQFHGFNAEDDPMLAWKDPSANGPWMFAPGEARHSETSDNFALLQRRMPLDSSELSVEAGFSFGAWGVTTLTSVRLGLIVDANVDETPGHSCWATNYVDVPNRVLLQEQIAEPAGGFTTSAEFPVIETSDRFSIRITRRTTPQDLACRIIVDGTAPVDAPVVTATGTWPTARHFGINSQNAAATLRYVVIYTRP